MIQLSKFAITASDVTGQRHVRVPDVPVDYTIGEVVDGLAAELRLAQRDRLGRPMPVEARLDREGRHLHRSEIVQDALQPEDHLVLHPRVMAGGRAKVS